MNKEEIKEYLKRVEELELKLTGEDKDTFQWLIYGYNECAKLVNQLENEITYYKIKNDKILTLIYDICENCSLQDKCPE